MNFRHVRMLLLLFTMILWNVLLNAWILERTRQINCFSYETALYSFREHRVSGELLARMQEEAEEKGMSEKELLAVYFAEDGSVTDPGISRRHMRGSAAIFLPCGTIWNVFRSGRWPPTGMRE